MSHTFLSKSRIVSCWTSWNLKFVIAVYICAEELDLKLIFSLCMIHIFLPICDFFFPFSHLKVLERTVANRYAHCVFCFCLWLKRYKTCCSWMLGGSFLSDFTWCMFGGSFLSNYYALFLFTSTNKFNNLCLSMLQQKVNSSSNALLSTTTTFSSWVAVVGGGGVARCRRLGEGVVDLKYL